MRSSDESYNDGGDPNHIKGVYALPTMPGHPPFTSRLLTLCDSILKIIGII